MTKNYLELKSLRLAVALSSIIFPCLAEAAERYADDSDRAMLAHNMAEDKSLPASVRWEYAQTAARFWGNWHQQIGHETPDHLNAHEIYRNAMGNPSALPPLSNNSYSTGGGSSYQSNNCSFGGSYPGHTLPASKAAYPTANRQNEQMFEGRIIRTDVTHDINHTIYQKTNPNEKGPMYNPNSIQCKECGETCHVNVAQNIMRNYGLNERDIEKNYKWSLNIVGCPKKNSHTR